MKRLITIVTLAILLVGLIPLGLSDTSVPNDEVTSSLSKAGNSSASATITITTTGALNE